MDQKLSVYIPENVDDRLIDAIFDAEQICFGKNAWSRRAVETFVGNSFSFAVIADLDGKLVGYATASVVFGEGELTNIAVLPEARRMGIAKQIMQKTSEHAKKLGAEMIHLEVREANLPAISLYEFFGFEKDGRRKNYYSSPREDAILMTLMLKG